jgi:hypothetical protein
MIYMPVLIRYNRIQGQDGMKVFRPDDGCFFNEALIWVERNDGNEVLDSGEIQGGLLFPGHRVKALRFLTQDHSPKIYWWFQSHHQK